jgi:hypothetical protein
LLPSSTLTLAGDTAYEHLVHLGADQVQVEALGGTLASHYGRKLGLRPGRGRGASGLEARRVGRALNCGRLSGSQACLLDWARSAELKWRLLGLRRPADRRDHQAPRRSRADD